MLISDSDLSNFYDKAQATNELWLVYIGDLTKEELELLPLWEAYTMVKMSVLRYVSYSNSNKKLKLNQFPLTSLKKNWEKRIL